MTYPADIPAGQANDVNIRLETDRGQVTLNYHLDHGTWSGTTSFAYAQHRLWPADVRDYTVTWVQVGGTNYHWSGALACRLGGEDRATGSTSGSTTVAPAQSVSQIDGFAAGRVKVRRGQRVASDIVTLAGVSAEGAQLEKRARGGWRAVGEVATEDGLAVVTYPKHRRKGTFRYRVHVPGGVTTSGVVSAVLKVRVR